MTQDDLSLNSGTTKMQDSQEPYFNSVEVSIRIDIALPLHSRNTSLDVQIDDHITTNTRLLAPPGKFRLVYSCIHVRCYSQTSP